MKWRWSCLWLQTLESSFQLPVSNLCVHPVLRPNAAPYALCVRAFPGFLKEFRVGFVMEGKPSEASFYRLDPSMAFQLGSRFWLLQSPRDQVINRSEDWGKEKERGWLATWAAVTLLTQGTRWLWSLTTRMLILKRLHELEISLGYRVKSVQQQKPKLKRLAGPNPSEIHSHSPYMVTIRHLPSLDELNT